MSRAELYDATLEALGEVDGSQFEAREVVGIVGGFIFLFFGSFVLFFLNLFIFN